MFMNVWITWKDCLLDEGLQHVGVSYGLLEFLVETMIFMHWIITLITNYTCFTLIIKENNLLWDSKAILARGHSLPNPVENKKMRIPCVVAGRGKMLLKKLGSFSTMCIDALSTSLTSSGPAVLCWRWIWLSAKAGTENSSLVGPISYKVMGAKEVTSWAILI